MINKTVTLIALRREMEFKLIRDCWHLARNGSLVDRPLSISLIEQAVKHLPEATFSIQHADAPHKPVSEWPVIAKTGARRLPSKGRTTFYRTPTPPSPPKISTLAPSTNIELEQRICACEDHQSAIIKSIQRMQTELADLMNRRQPMENELAVAQGKLEEISEQVSRNQFSIAGVRLETMGAA